MITNIKKNEPNPKLIEELEKYLEDAKSGELRSLFCVAENSSGETYRSWAMSWSTDKRKVYSEIAIAQLEFSIDMAMDYNSPILKKLVD